VFQTNGDPIPNARVSLSRTDMPLGAFAQMVASDRPPIELVIPGETLAMLVQRIAFDDSLPEAKAMASLNLADIHEMTVSPSGAITVIPRSNPPVVTDHEGRFAFTRVPPGIYKVTVAADGYARQDYGQRNPSSPGALLTLTSGQTRDDLVVRLLRVGAASGHVFDSARRPIAGIPVELFRFAYNEDGKQSLIRVATAQTDDRGAYRLFYITPGRYYLSAGNEPGNTNLNQPAELVRGAGGPRLSPNRIAQAYTKIWYPGTTDVKNATVIDMQQGAELEGMDLVLNVPQLLRIRGSILDPAVGRPPANVQIELVSGVTAIRFEQAAPYYNAADGTFDLRGVSPGTYVLTATIAPPRPTRFDAAFVNREAVARTVVTVGDTDVEGVIVTFVDSSFLSGKMRLDQGVPAPEGKFTFANVKLLRPDDLQPALSREPQSSVSEDGGFRIGNVFPGDYRIAVIGLPAGYYVSQARIGDLDVVSSTFRFSGADPGAFEIVIGMGSGQVSGAVKDAEGKPVSGAHVVLIPTNHDRVELFRPATTDPAGKFSIAGVTPGDYVLGVWDDIEAFEFFDPALLGQADEKGQRLRVGEGSQTPVNLTPFPLPDRKEP
jgi:5-hydroxyisourate hydrolase-like protein (transthyretin family)